MEAIIEYIRQLFYISSVQTPLLIIFAIFIFSFIITLIINKPYINTFFKRFCSILLLLLVSYILLNSNTNLISKGQLSLLPHKCQQVSVVNDFIATIQKCNKYNRDSYSFELLIINKTKQRTISIRANQTRLLDWSGNNNFAQKVSIGNGQFRNKVNTIIPRDIPMKANIVFENTSLEGNLISLLEVKSNNANFLFHNVLISE